MISFDVTDTAFIQDLDVEEANSWMNDNVGAILHDEWEHSYGDGWQLRFDDICGRWVMEIEKEDRAVLFQLMWG